MWFLLFVRQRLVSETHLASEYTSRNELLKLFYEAVNSYKEKNAMVFPELLFYISMDVVNKFYELSLSRSYFRSRFKHN